MTHLIEEWAEKKKTYPGSFDAQHLWARKIARHMFRAWFRPETKAWMKPELASLLSVAMTTAAISSPLCVKRLKGLVAEDSAHTGGGGGGGDSQIKPSYTQKWYLKNLGPSSVKWFFSISALRGLFTARSWRRYRVCCYCWQVQEQVEQVVLWMPLCWALLPPPPPPCFPLQDGWWFSLTKWQVSEKIWLPVHLFSSDTAERIR